MSEAKKNLLVRNTGGHYPFYAYEDGWLDGRSVGEDGRPWDTTDDYDFSCELTPGKYTLTVECDGPDAFMNESVCIQSSSDVSYSAEFTAGAGISQPLTFEVTDETAGTWRFVGKRRGARWRVALHEGATAYAWSPYVSETLAGGGALMSANLLEGVTPTLMHGTTESDGVWHNAGRTIADDHEDWLVWDLAGQSALATNQTYHVGLSTRGAGANSASLHATIGYKDAAGNVNWATSDPLPIGTSWGRAEATIVVPSGMTPFGFYVAAYGTCPETWMASPTLSLGSPVTLASSAHTPYATQDHLRSEYATKAALKAAATHTHAIADVTGLQAALDGIGAETASEVSALGTRMDDAESSIAELAKRLPIYYYTDVPSESSITEKPQLAVIKGGAVYLVE